jgi:hypothetical protein
LEKIDQKKDSKEKNLTGDKKEEARRFCGRYAGI